MNTRILALAGIDAESYDDYIIGQVMLDSNIISKNDIAIRLIDWATLHGHPIQVSKPSPEVGYLASVEDGDFVADTFSGAVVQGIEHILEGDTDGVE